MLYYRFIADDWISLYNANYELSEIALGSKNKESIINNIIWKRIKEVAKFKNLRKRSN
ncbi:MAG: hypothetical protein ACYCT7_08450 [bacterium]